jgi:hypothetical protein
MPKVGERFNPCTAELEMVYIPDSIMRMRISHGAKLAVGALGYMVHKNILPSATNLSDQIGLSVRRVHEILRELSKARLVHKNPVIEESDAVLLLKDKNSGTGLSVAALHCTWCRTATVRLHEHHYPVRKKDGGTETVSICPNCHSEFHALTDDKWAVDVDFEGFYA